MSRILPNEAIQRLTPRGVIRKAKGVAASTPIEFVREAGDNEYPTLYLVRRGKQGFVIPADDKIRPFLADCDSIDFTVELPPSLIDLLGEYDRQITQYQNCGIDIGIGGEMFGDSDRQSIQPLLKTVWAQGSPYNDRLLFNGEKCVVGCVALSMAQILYYWGVVGKDGKKYHRGCIGTEAYTTRTNKYKVDALPPITKFDYDHLTLKTPASSASIKAMSIFLEYCGKALQSNYGTSVTSAYNVAARDVLKSHFRMGSPTMIYASSGEAKFEEKVYKELVNGRPIMIAGYRAGGYGHMFNCDGYDASKDLFHFNLGWGGSGNGWYAMTAIKPKADKEYTINLSAIIGIQPDYILGDVNGDGKIDISDVSAAAGAVLNDRYSDKADVNSDGSVTIEDATLISNHILGKGKKL